ncbi:unnamed protein product, partial [Meganyctiphanes norvegica]
SLKVYVKRGQLSLEDHITANVKLHLLPQKNDLKQDNSARSGQRGSDVPPVLSRGGNRDFNASLRLICENRATCFSQPDLGISAMSRPSLQVGQRLVGVNVTIIVKEDQAYGVIFTVRHPPVFSFLRATAYGYSSSEYKYVRWLSTHIDEEQEEGQIVGASGCQVRSADKLYSTLNCTVAQELPKDTL